MTAASPLLDVRGLVVEVPDGRGGRRPIVDGVSLDVAPGEVLGLIGESGAGKSTLGLAALGHARGAARFAAGRVVLAGTDLLRLSPSALSALRGRSVAYVAQSAAAAFNPALTLDAQVTEVPLRRRLAPDPAAARRDAAALYAELGLPDPDRFGRRYPHQASGGQLQRAMLAMALAGRPDLIVLDEPTTALDVTTQLGVLAAIRRAIRDRGTAALYVSHDLAVVAQMADRILVLKDGRPVETGPTARVLGAPRDPYTRALVAAGRTDVPLGTATAAEPPLLAVRGVSARYARRGPLAVEAIDLEVPRGRTVAVVGESGSGKSTLARVVAGLLPPTTGAVVLAGHPLPPHLASRTRDQLRRVQLVHQSPDLALNPRQRVAEILGRPLQLFHGLRGRPRRERVEQLLDQVGLPPDYAARYPTELSGGQQQRVCLARAVAAEPDLIILDEATSALDPLVAAEILALLARLRDATGTAYLLITHDLGAARRAADRVAVLRAGRVVDQGTAAEVLDRPRHPYTARLLASVPETRAGWLEEALLERDAQPALV